MIKGIKHWKMQSKDTKVVVRSFAGAKVRLMTYYAKPAEEDNPSLCILHLGSNDLTEDESALEIANEITSLARSLKRTITKLQFLAFVLEEIISMTKHLV